MNVQSFSFGSASNLGKKKFPFVDFETTEAVYRKRIGNRGASTAPICWLFDEAGNQIGHLSYNGRAWTGAPWDWSADKEPVWSPGSN